MIRKAVFLDRDGTINEDPGYLKNPSDLKLLPGTADALARLKKEGFLLLVVSNQSGVARGLLSVDDVNAVNLAINRILEIDNAAIDRFYFCPHHPDFGLANKCQCRKPETGMIDKAVADFSVDRSRSFLIGNMGSDIQCANNAGIKAVLVNSPQRDDALLDIKNLKLSLNCFADNLQEAVNFILKEVHETKKS